MLALTVHRCLEHRTLRYLTYYCVPVSEVPGHHPLRSVRRRQLSVPRDNRSTSEPWFSCRWTNSQEFTVGWPVWSGVDSEHENASIHWTRSVGTRGAL